MQSLLTPGRLVAQELCGWSCVPGHGGYRLLALPPNWQADVPVTNIKSKCGEKCELWGLPAECKKSGLVQDFGTKYELIELPTNPFFFYFQWWAAQGLNL